MILAGVCSWLFYLSVDTRSDVAARTPGLGLPCRRRAGAPVQLPVASLSDDLQPSAL